jgi:hypothetical protein
MTKQHAENIFAFTRDAVAEFDCTVCGAHVYRYGDRDFTHTICRTCEFIGEHPQLSDEAKALLRGDRS